MTRTAECLCQIYTLFFACITLSLRLSLCSLISPLHYHGDFRPYFTIYDIECPAYASKKTELPATIVGVTNPYFVNAFEHWPSLVRVGAVRPRGRRSESGTLPSGASPPASSLTSSPLLPRSKQGAHTQHCGFPCFSFVTILWRPFLILCSCLRRSVVLQAGPVRRPRVCEGSAARVL